MGIFNKIKKFFSFEEKEEKIEVKIKLSELDSWINSELENIKNIKKQLKENFDAKKMEFIEKIRQDTSKLKDINWSKYKVEETTKIAVKQGLLTYIMHLNSFLEAIEKTNKDIEQNLQLVNKNFAVFEKNSLVSYHKATILIGEEIGKITEDLREFSKYDKALYEENSGLFRKREILENIKRENRKLIERKNYEKQINELMLKTKQEIENTEKQKQESEKGFEEFKKSHEYQAEIEQEKQIKEKQNRLQIEIALLRQDLNFRFLKKVLHSDENKIKLIKKYEESIIDAIKFDEQFKIIEIINAVLSQKEAPSTLREINEDRIKKLIEKSVEIKNVENNVKKPSLGYINEIKGSENKILDFKKEISDFEEKNKKILEREKEVIGEISNLIKRIDERLILVEN